MEPRVVTGRRGRSVDDTAARVFDCVGAALLLILIAPLFALIGMAIKLDSPGPVFYRCRRVGRDGAVFAMLKFRKMAVDAAGPPLTLAGDARFTRIGRMLAAWKLDELPQLWNVLTGDMSLVGPRPEDPSFVDLRPLDYEEVLRVRPGITGLSQLAFVEEGRILDPLAFHEYYVQRLLPQKIEMDKLYARRRSLRLNLSILLWTVVAVAFRTDVAVNRTNGQLGVRRRPAPKTNQEPTDAFVLIEEPVGSKR
jgi:lipopolysaccharide/colanic/teichoic acid biosynthesis glycosyltransferase